MGKEFLIDTNVLIDAQSGRLSKEASTELAEIINKDFNISIISYIEFLGYKNSTKSMYDFVNLANIIELDRKIVLTTIDIRKQYKIKLPDAIIAATALTYNVELITRNLSDFNSIKQIKIKNLYK